MSNCDDLLTLEKIKEHYEAWCMADLNGAAGQSYSIGGRSLTRMSAQDVRDQMAYWKKLYVRKKCYGTTNGPIAVRAIPHG